MSLFVKIVGVLVCVLSMIPLVKPGSLGRILGFFKQKNRIYYLVPIRIGFGVTFLLGAGKCSIPWLITLFGILFILKGIGILISGPVRIKAQLELWQNKSSLVVRILAVIGLALGVIIIYAA